MAVIVVECSGECWQDDFAPLLPELNRIFGWYFRREYDLEDLRHEAVCMFMVNFRSSWRAGATIRLATSFTVMAMRRGRRFNHRLRSRKRGSAATNCLPTLTACRARQERIDARIDYRQVLDELPYIDARIVHSLVAGRTLREIKSDLHVGYKRIKATAEKAVAMLNR
jgi:hypothetical protein